MQHTYLYRVSKNQVYEVEFNPLYVGTPERDIGHLQKEFVRQEEAGALSYGALT